jgi:hypothetical protein
MTADPLGFRSQRRRRRWLALFAAALLVVVLAFAALQRERQGALEREGLVQMSNRFERVKDFASAAAGAGISTVSPQSIQIGIQISNIYNVSLPNQTFMANGYFWIAWPETVQQWMAEQGISSEQLIDFPNNIISYDFLIQPTRDKPQKTGDGLIEQTFMFSGHFWAEAIDFRSFPFQRLRLPIRFEISPEPFALNGSYPVSLVANPRQSDLLGTQIHIPGLVLEGASLEPIVHRFNDDGSFLTGDTASYFSQVLSMVVFSTHPITAIGRWLVPILIVMLMVFLAPSLSGHLSEIRIAIPSAALLTLVVMQMSSESAMPELDYLTFIDLIYLWCYAITAGLFILFVWSSNQYDALNIEGCTDPDRLAVVKGRIAKADRRFQAFSVLGTIVLVLLLLLR